MATYYNEIDPYCAQWLRNLIAAGEIPEGEVDERSIADVRPADLAGFAQCHFFAGIGGWALALRLAGWGDRAVWTGSCPCQPFSAAGKRAGHADSRHLWPEFYRLIQSCSPPVVFGEQVASADVLGKAGGIAPQAPECVWLDRVRIDLEAAHYTFGACDLPAAGVGAPHIRQRVWWVAESEHAERRAVGFNRQNERHWQDSGRAQAHSEPRARGEVCGLAFPERDTGRPWRPAVKAGEGAGTAGERASVEPGRPSDLGFWSYYSLIPCLDGKARRTQSGLQPLAHGVPARVGKLRAYGNAIVPALAAEFILASREALDEIQGLDERVPTLTEAH